VDFDNSFIEAFSLKVSDSFVIVVKQSARLRDCLEQEFKHTLKDDYTLTLISAVSSSC